MRSFTIGGMASALYSTLATVGDSIETPLWAIGEGGCLVLRRMSPTQLVGTLASGAFEPGARVSLRISGAALEVGPLSGTVEEVEDGDDGSAPRVRVALGPLTLLEGRAVLALLEAVRASSGLEPEPPREVTEVVREPRRVVSLIRQIFDLRCESRFLSTEEAEAGGRGTAARPEELLPGTPLPLVWGAAPPCPAPPFDVQVVWMNWEYRFRVKRAVVDGGRVRTSVPDEIVRVRERFHRRASAPTGASLEFRHPLWPELTVRRPLEDVSLRGASFATQVVEDGIFPGLELPFVEAVWPTGERARFRGAIRRLAHGGHERIVAGASLEPFSDEDADLWHKLIDRSFFRHTFHATAEADPLWELYERSGYFNLSGKTEQEFRELRDAFRRVTTIFDRPNEVGTHIVMPSGGHAHSAITVIKPYEHAWFPCQLAQEKESAPERLSTRRVLLEVMLHAFELVSRDPGFHWVVNWVQVESRFSRAVSYELTKRFADPDHACVVRFRAMEARTDDDVGASALDGYEVGPATDAEVRLLLDAIAACRPLSYRESHDLVPERMDVEDIARRWRRSGLARRRHITVARQNGVPLAAGVMDLVEDGVHLFGLLDVLRTFALAPGGEQAFGAVVEASRAWYREQGKGKFAYFVEHEDYEHAVRAGFKDLGEADLVVLGARYMPDQMQHLWEVMAPKDKPPLRAVVAHEMAGLASG